MTRHWDETMLQAAPHLPVTQEGNSARRASDGTTTSELHFRELIGLLRRRSRLILTIAFCGTMLTFAVGLMIPPKYTAKALIGIDPQSSGAQAATPSRDEAVIETHVTVLLSRDHLQRVVGNLPDDPEFRRAAPTVRPTEADGIADRVPRPPAAARWLPGPSELAHRLKIWTGRASNNGDEEILNIDEIKRHLNINQEGRSRIIAVRYTTTDPDTAAAIANRIAELYVDGQSEQKHAYTSAESARLDSRIAELKVDIDRSGAAVQAAFMQQRSSAAKPVSEAREADQQLLKLERDAVVKGQLYNTLLRRQQEIRDQEAAAPDARILSLAATPDRPSSANPFLFIFPALIMFLICGSLLAVILEMLDCRLRSEREINEALGIRCLGLIPQVVTMETTQLLNRHLATEPFAAYAKAFRAIAATMQLASPLRQSNVVLITSSLPGEGKTSVAVSLSTCIARMRQRVLLIDLDFKNLSIVRELEGNPEQGILDILLNNCVPAEVIRHVPELGLDYMPMSRCSFDPLMLFVGEEIPRLLDQLRGSYDCVIIDSPPVLGSTETRLLAAMADSILFVVKWGSTRREVALNALNLLRGPGRLPAQQLPPVSALIAQVDLNEHVRYGYGDAAECSVTHEKYSSRFEYASLLKSRLVGELGLPLLRKCRTALSAIHFLRLRISK
jgi:succinoglycan biosynthesis transport protein ExoP